MTDRPPDEKWIRGDTGDPYWRESTAHEARTEWIVIHGGPEPSQNGSGPSKPPQEAPAPNEPVLPEPTPIPLTKRQLVENLMDALRKGDRSAMDRLRDLIKRDGGPDAA